MAHRVQLAAVEIPKVCGPWKYHCSGKYVELTSSGPRSFTCLLTICVGTLAIEAADVNCAEVYDCLSFLVRNVEDNGRSLVLISSLGHWP